MSENTDRIIDTHLKQRPGALHAYDHDSTMHYDIEKARSMLGSMESAMQREGIPYDSAERVLNEIVSAGLDGWERAKRSRERMLLLADMAPSPSIEQRRREREINAQWDANREALDRAADRLTGQPIPEWLQSRPMDIPVTDTPVFTEPGSGAAQLTDGTPEQLAAWIEKRQARLIELTGFDLRVPPEGDDGPVRPDEEPAP